MTTLNDNFDLEQQQADRLEQFLQTQAAANGWHNGTDSPTDPTDPDLLPQAGYARLLTLTVRPAESVSSALVWASRLEKDLVRQQVLKTGKPVGGFGLFTRRHKTLTMLAAVLVLALILPLVLAILDASQADPKRYGTGNPNTGLPLLPRLGAPPASAADGDPDLPPLIRNQLGNMNYKLAPNASLPAQIPAQLPAYRQRIEPWSRTDAAAFAANLGFDAATLQEDNPTDAFVFTKADGAKLALSRSARGLWSYYARPANGTLYPGQEIFGQASDASPLPTPGSGLSFGSAKQIATDYLITLKPLGANYNLQTAVYESLRQSNAASTPVQFVDFIQTIDGKPVYGPTLRVTVNGNREIVSVVSALLPLEKSADYPIIDNRQLTQELEKNRLPLYQSDLSIQRNAAGNQNGVIFSQSKSMSLSVPANITPNPLPAGPRYKVGQVVELTGGFNVEIYKFPNNSLPERFVAMLYVNQGKTNYTFYLVGDKARQITNLSGFNIRLTGRIKAEIPYVSEAPDPLGEEYLQYKLELTDLNARKEPADQERFDFFGKISLTNIGGKDYKLLEDENGSRYLEALPKALTPEMYQQLLQREKERIARLLVGGKTSGSIQTTGEKVDGIPVVRVRRTNSNPKVQRGDARRDEQIPQIIEMPPPVVPNGTAITVSDLQLGYYANPVVNSLVELKAGGSPDKLLAQPVYRVTGGWTTDGGQTTGKLQLFAPAARPDYIAP